VIATYHLGPLDAAETRAYIEHRLHTVGWNGDPSFSDDAYEAIYEFTGGIPRRINTLCDRLFLMGYLDEIRDFRSPQVREVIRDIRQEFVLPAAEPLPAKPEETRERGQPNQSADTYDALESMDKRLAKMERSVISVLGLLKKILSLPSVKNLGQKEQS
jgi:hypothetical protein